MASVLVAFANFLVRFVMRRSSRREDGETDTSRDPEHTDWAAVDRSAVDFPDQTSANRRVEVPPRAAPGARA